MNMTGLHKSSKARTGKKMNWSSFLGFLAFDFYRFCVVICFFIPATTANDLGLQRISIPDFIHYIFFSYLNSSERAIISLFSVGCQTRELVGLVKILIFLQKTKENDFFRQVSVFNILWPQLGPTLFCSRSQHMTFLSSPQENR